jgi:hypothetical protein
MQSAVASGSLSRQGELLVGWGPGAANRYDRGHRHHASRWWCLLNRTGGRHRNLRTGRCHREDGTHRRCNRERRRGCHWLRRARRWHCGGRIGRRVRHIQYAHARQHVHLVCMRMRPCVGVGDRIPGVLNLSDSFVGPQRGWRGLGAQREDRDFAEGDEY